MKNESDSWEAFWSEATSWRDDRPATSTALVPIQPKIVDATVVTAVVSPHRQTSAERTNVLLLPQIGGVVLMLASARRFRS